MAGVLTLLGASEDRAVAVRFSKLGSMRVLSLAMAQSALSNLVFAAISFVLRRDRKREVECSTIEVS
jgi:hypothetical protein